VNCILYTSGNQGIRTCNFVVPQNQ